MQSIFVRTAAALMLCGSSAMAATLDSYAYVRNLNVPSGGGIGPQVIDADSGDGVSSSTVGSSISGSGAVAYDVPGAGLSAGDAFNSASAESSINYATGEIRAVVEAETTPGVAAGANSVAQAGARLADQVSFSFDPTNPLLDVNTDSVSFQWFVERDIVGLGSLRTFFRVADPGLDPGLGGILYTVDERFTESGSQLSTFDILLRDLPSVIGLDARIFSARAETRCDGGCQDLANWFTDSFVDAGSTAILNIITPAGVTFEGTGTGLLSDMRVIGVDDMSVVPLPASLPMLLAGLGGLGLLARRRVRTA